VFKSQSEWDIEYNPTKVSKEIEPPNDIPIIELKLAVPDTLSSCQDQVFVDGGNSYMFGAFPIRFVWTFEAIEGTLSALPTNFFDWGNAAILYNSMFKLAK
jgi:hypothetical protein